jgi:hypothetical protein
MQKDGALQSSAMSVTILKILRDAARKQCGRRKAGRPDQSANSTLTMEWFAWPTGLGDRLPGFIQSD